METHTRPENAMTLSEAIAQFHTQLLADSRSPNTIGSYLNDVGMLTDWLAGDPTVDSITAAQLAEFVASDTVQLKRDGTAKATGSVNKVKASLRAFFGYLVYTYWEQRRGHRAMPEELDLSEPPRSWLQIAWLLSIGLTGVLVSSHGIVLAAEVVALAMGVSDIIIALVVVALGTSIPEIATCVAAARKRQGSLAIGNILGADILNICWIAGASATVHDLVVAEEVIHFMFPAMLIIVFTMLALMRLGHSFERWKGLVLLTMCAVYIVLLLVTNPGALVPT